MFKNYKILYDKIKNTEIQYTDNTDVRCDIQALRICVSAYILR